MSGIKISALPAVGSALLTDFFPVVQAGVTSQETLNQVLTLFQANIVTPANGGVLYTDASRVQLLAPTATANQVLLSGSNAAPAWSTATYPATTTINQLLFSSAANTIGGLATANSAQLVTSSAGVPSMTATMTNGQVVIGSTGATPVPATLTAGTNISITNGAGSITIAATGAGGFSWTDVTGATQTMASNNGYVADRAAGNVAFTLPASSVIGDELQVIGRQNGWSIAQGAGQQIFIGSVGTTVGAGGSVASTNAHDALYLVCTVANLEWTAGSAPQSSGLTIV